MRSTPAPTARVTCPDRPGRDPAPTTRAWGLRELGAGLVGGVAGTAAMSTVQRVDQALSGRPPARLAAQALADVTGRARRDAAERARHRRDHGAVGDDALADATGTPTTLAGAPRTPAPSGVRRVDTVLHYAYGAGWGLVRGGRLGQLLGEMRQRAQRMVRRRHPGPLPRRAGRRARPGPP